MFRLSINFIFVLVVLGEYAAAQNSAKSSFRNLKFQHEAKTLSRAEIKVLAGLSDEVNFNETLKKICIVRVVGTPEHTQVRKYIEGSLKKLGWSIEIDAFEEKTPNLGNLTFRNIIARLNPRANRYLALACHYDSKYTREGSFVGATDSAVPCAQMINLATVMRKYLEPLKQADLSLMFIFFDGEEAFHTWNATDSIYGARHLANKWHESRIRIGHESYVTDLDKLDILVLLDLLGAPDPMFYNYFDETQRWYSLMAKAENQLSNLTLFKNYSYGKPLQAYFQPHSFRAGIEDDHIPFWKKNVPILHIIPSPFPSFWHTSKDNMDNINLSTIDNLNKIFRVFVAAYLKLDLEDHK